MAKDTKKLLMKQQSKVIRETNTLGIKKIDSAFEHHNEQQVHTIFFPTDSVQATLTQNKLENIRQAEARTVID